MFYEVIRYFRDAQDNGHVYRVGDKFPREGHSVSAVRLKDLLSGNNFQNVPLIKRVDSVGHFVNKVVKEPKEEGANIVVDEVVAETKEEVKEEKKAANKDGFTAEEIDKMPFMKLKSVAKKNGVPVENREAKDIRDDLKKELGV